MDDITLRALDVLARADVIAAEDTRSARRLLARHGIASAQLLALHRHNERQAAEALVSRLSQGLAVALVTDAGTPAISDPGALLVQAVRAAGQRIVPVPGASAVVTALSASGLSDPHFLFYGFLNSKPSARRRALQELAAFPHTMAFYEAPHRVRETLQDMLAAWGGSRQVVIARELTKLFETLHACTLAEALSWLDADADRLRGEFVLLVSGAENRPDEALAKGVRVLDILLPEMPLKQAVQLAAKITGASKNILYNQALEKQKGV